MRVGKLDGWLSGAPAITPSPEAPQKKKARLENGY
jgi:hypothetical protein